MLSLDSPLIRRQNRRHPALRVFCLPYAGAGASVFNGWPDLFPDDIEVAAIQLPGREDRQQEAPFTELGPMVRAIVAALRPYLLTPMALFGHCAGALLAFEVAAECRRRFAVTPRHLFVSAQAAPHLPARNTPIHTLPDDQLRAQLHRLAGAAPEVLTDDTVMDLLMPCVRADFTVWERYDYRPRTPLSCPITAFSGEHDSRTAPADMAEWQQHTSASFALRSLAGGHFFVNEMPGEIVREMVSALR